MVMRRRRRLVVAATRCEDVAKYTRVKLERYFTEQSFAAHARSRHHWTPHADCTTSTSRLANFCFNYIIYHTRHMPHTYRGPVAISHVQFSNHSCHQLTKQHWEKSRSSIGLAQLQAQFSRPKPSPLSYFSDYRLSCAKRQFHQQT